jgi:hypothetical protein
LLDSVSILHALNRSDDGFGYLSAAVAHAMDARPCDAWCSCELRHGGR